MLYDPVIISWFCNYNWTFITQITKGLGFELKKIRVMKVPSYESSTVFSFSKFLISPTSKTKITEVTAQKRHFL